MLEWCLRLLARLPLAWLHAAGALLGRFVYLSSPAYAARMRENLRASGLCADPRESRRLLRHVIAEAGKAVGELPFAWYGMHGRIERLVRCDAWAVVEEAQRAGCGIIFLTPHLGAFEIAALYAARRLPLTVLYRPPKLAFLEPVMIAGRGRFGTTLAPARLKGVRMLYRALARGEAVGLLPDQAPGRGEGVWADFFGRPAYTMTLVRRLKEATDAAVIMAVAERLPRGAGYQLRLERVEGGTFDEPALNRAIERVIRNCPAQYLWSYNRYKVPAGAEPPVARSES